VFKQLTERVAPPARLEGRFLHLRHDRRQG
jgi:hypothetical protein